ncbi:helix-turn-helix domain-containing protein [Marinactinospora thermotolerans]|uniref:Helix-turn-helix domain-containing protein n=1 Tax=Marinactinospora thermotolerans DSM 45154 TaxID=1122192 RepID=A0A1T4TFX7_9ACTN|nr:helix-turn-helix transcriptional regulator [Marinactinospora thermotolerans]SKA39332.1 Helix-turn-helix domain-containing protein [Marinactinospora thermotolerans DSM 45154]
MAHSPTLRRRRLSRRLRELRAARGLTTEVVVQRARETATAKWSRHKLTRIERDDWVLPSLDDVRTLLDIYGVTDEAERATYLTLAAEARQRGWWASYGDILGRGAYVGLEAEAQMIRTYEVLVIPGLLQTEDYARAVIRGGGLTNSADVERRVEARVMRQTVLRRRPDAPRLWAIIDEAALRKIPSQLLQEQAQHLLDIQEQASVRVQILPDSVGPHAATSGAFTILDLPDDDPSVVYRENVASGIFLDDPADLEEYITVYDHIRGSSLGVDQSRAYLEALIEGHDHA